MARGKCINCRIANAGKEAAAHPNFVTNITSRWLVENRKQFRHTLDNCQIVTARDEEGNPTEYLHRLRPIVDQAVKP